MRAAILESPRNLVIREVPDPVSPEGGLVLDIRAALTCGTDVKTYLRGHPMIPLPSPLGHEFSGVVSAVGRGCRGFKEGDEVMAVHSAPCLDCSYCRRKLFNLCEKIMDTKVLGAFAEKLALPRPVVEQNAFHKSPAISFAQAAFLEPLACVVHGLRICHAEAGESVVIFGAGPIGLLFTMLLKTMNCRVTVIEPHAGRRAMAEKLCADLVCESEKINCPQFNGADLVIDCTGIGAVWTKTIDYVRKGGRVLLFGGVPAGSVAGFDATRLHYDEIALHGVFHFTPADVVQAAEHLTSGRLDPTPLITNWTGPTGLTGLKDAFEALARGEGIKYLVQP